MGKDFLSIIIKSQNQMNKDHQDPFIIIRSHDYYESIDSLPEIKYRKPTKHTWTPLQNFHYVSFLKENMEAMESKQNRKLLKVFRLMAKIIKTRSPTQVKSHHQKLQRKYRKIKTIIAKVQQMLSKIQLPSFKDAETSFELKVENQEEIINNEEYTFFPKDVIQKRSYEEEVFFQPKSDIYLVFEENWFRDNDQPLI